MKCRGCEKECPPQAKPKPEDVVFGWWCDDCLRAQSGPLFPAWMAERK